MEKELRHQECVLDKKLEDDASIEEKKEGHFSRCGSKSNDMWIEVNGFATEEYVVTGLS